MLVQVSQLMLNSLCRLIFNRYSLFLAGVYLYARAVDYLGGLEAGSLNLQWLELLFVVYLYGWFYLILRPGRWRALIAALPLLVGYLVQDVYYLAYGKVFRLIEVLELPELLQVLPAGYLALAGVCLLLPLLVFLAVINYRALRLLGAGALPLVLLAVLVAFAPTAYTAFVQAAGNGIVKYSDAKSVESNGRYIMMFYREAERLNALAATRPFRQRADYDGDAERKATYISHAGNDRNVHLIVLESFLDPTLFSGAHFSRNPVHPDFEQLFGDRLGLSLSPVFGGATAQAEFEILCGVPALEKLSSVEFNVFSGAPAHCLPGLLEQAGYLSVATNAYKPNFFNALPAYTGSGFSEIYFPQEFSATRTSYFSTGDVQAEDYLFDGALFEQNLAFVASRLAETGRRPLFNYIMAIYGHTPHILDPVRRPEVLQIESDYADDHLQRAANQFYYRSGAIAAYVNALLKLDPNSLIILVSDHVPPLRNGPNTYRKLGYLDNVGQSYYYNRLLVIENGRPVAHDRIRHFDLPDMVLDYVTDGEFCRVQRCEFLADTAVRERESYLDAYYSLMAHASE
jgi:phosphoglycerol transferase MdoB-like AlkP superfamily enzyme